MIGRAVPLTDLTEKEWDAQLFNPKTGLATALGWDLVYHTLRSKGSQPGFPDRVLVRDRVIFTELKTETGKPTDRQQAWLTGLAKAGAEAYLWRPSDLGDVGAVLASRHRIQVGSAWLPAGCRADQHPAIHNQEGVAA